MKKILIIFAVAAAAIIIAIGMNKRESAASADRTGNGAEVADTVRDVATSRDSAAAPAAGKAMTHYPDLDLAKGHQANSIRKDYEGFRLAFNPSNKTPSWVAWELLGRETDGTTVRSDRFWQDADLEGCPTTGDYARSGYDRGHLCPAAEQKWNPKAMEDCFVMANMCPQDHALNSGAWNTLENKERAWAQRDSAIVIVAGPIYEKSDTKRIGESRVRVPGAFFKVIVAPYADNPRGIGFVFPNMSSPGSMENYVTTIDDVEKLTGLDFFYNLPDDIEDKVESTASFREWNRK